MYKRIQLAVLLIVPILMMSITVAAQDISIEEHWFEQPVDHQQVNGETFKQQVWMLKPKTLTANYQVFFILGNETDATRAAVERLYRAYSSPSDMVFIWAEHRGYGQSITNGSQTVPDYITIADTLADYHRVVEHFKAQYPVPWLAAGYSYGGALAINFAHSYPKDVDAILSSSAPIDWTFQIPKYSEQVLKNLGKPLTDRLANHILKLQPTAPYDGNWQDRELLSAVITLLSQRETGQSFKPVIDELSNFTTEEFLNKLRNIIPEEGLLYVSSRQPRAVNYQQSSVGNLNWRTWKYQQCSEVGSFFGGYPFQYTKAELINDCKAVFGVEPEILKSEGWRISDMVKELNLPHVAVVGGKDPWARIGIQANHGNKNLEYVYVENKLHCPDKEDKQLGAKVISLLRNKVGSR
jgi:pimeloyl-ACP methyl ester carboxylesterase